MLNSALEIQENLEIFRTAQNFQFRFGSFKAKHREPSNTRVRHPRPYVTLCNGMFSWELLPKIHLGALQLSQRPERLFVMNWGECV